MNHKLWKIIQTIGLLLIVVGVLTFASGDQPAQARATLPVSVPADVEWVSTGIWLYSDWVGGEVNINTVGFVTTRHGWSGAKSGPEGQQNAICEASTDGDIEYTCALAGVPYGQLIGRVGDVVFPISDAASFTIPAKGFLYLTVNDYLGTYYDNAGEFTVLIDLK